MHMLKKLALGFAGLMAAGSPASAAVIINFTGSTAIPGSNDFQSDLNGLGLNQLASGAGTSILLDADSMISFELLGTESSLDDTFSAPGVSYTEMTTLLNSFATPIALGSSMLSAGDLAGLLMFSASAGGSATIGDPGFGIFIGPDFISGGTTSVFYLGYDDRVTNQDDDFDDFVVRATVTPLSAVPEAGTWAMMLLGFGLAGLGLRRRSGRTLPQLA